MVSIVVAIIALVVAGLFNRVIKRVDRAGEEETQ